MLLLLLVSHFVIATLCVEMRVLCELLDLLSQVLLTGTHRLNLVAIMIPIK